MYNFLYPVYNRIVLDYLLLEKNCFMDKRVDGNSNVRGVVYFIAGASVHISFSRFFSFPVTLCFIYNFSVFVSTQFVVGAFKLLIFKKNIKFSIKL